MAETHGDGRRATAPPDLPSREESLQVVLPNIHGMSRDSFKPGTLSRRRMNRALLGVLGLGVIVTCGITVASVLGWL